MFTQPELQLLRQSLEVITILGKDAKTVSTLQIKLEQLIQENQIKELEQADNTSIKLKR